jgi:hypothetical protein
MANERLIRQRWQQTLGDCLGCDLLRRDGRVRIGMCQADAHAENGEAEGKR